MIPTPSDSPGEEINLILNDASCTDLTNTSSTVSVSDFTEIKIIINNDDDDDDEDKETFFF